MPERGGRPRAIRSIIMGKVLRRLFTVASILSLLVCVITAATLIASAFGDFTLWTRGDGVDTPQRTVSLIYGNISLRSESGLSPIPTAADPLRPNHEDGKSIGAVDAPGMHFRASVRTAMTFSSTPLPGVYGRQITFWISLAWPLIASGIPPLVWLIVFLCQGTPRERRIARGECPACGYDLRATADRCPECGVAAEGRDSQPLPRMRDAYSADR